MKSDGKKVIFFRRQKKVKYLNEIIGENGLQDQEMIVLVVRFMNVPTSII